MADDPERARIVQHFRNGFFRRNPSPPQPVHEAFFESLEATLRETVGDEPLDFVELVDGKRGDADDFGSALILAGGLLYKLHARNENLSVVFIGAPVGGVYREDTELGEGKIVRTRIAYEHPRLTELNVSAAFIVLPTDAHRYVGLRRRLRRWGQRGIRVWGARTI